MAVLILMEEGEEGWVRCSECDIEFLLVWNRGAADGAEYCPFCGDEIDMESEGA